MYTYHCFASCIIWAVIIYASIVILNSKYFFKIFYFGSINVCYIAKDILDKNEHQYIVLKWLHFETVGNS